MARRSSGTNYFDINGPREIALTPAGAQSLGRWLVVITTVASALFLLLWTAPWGFVAFFVLASLVASSANSVARPVITRWLDRFDQR